ncbi:TM2 domain-containing protein [Mangrovivirga sp. M17]|uniref:TM2 domain-containing protein n=1 Tax=Mangrovivirga halotolerans TaxID=2993936 RepID=A0ABT3RND8_9BACT|nr:TM2 domain-containing protein [Mangrovivirga halotolerans]MCX2743115.1 TM2 domain-containing protein [Mangrovivirga halotolerans]
MNIHQINNKHILFGKIKSPGVAYLCWFILGCHYAYLGRWGVQILYWLTFGGLGIWAIIDIFLIPSKVERHNREIYMRIDQIEKEEKSMEYEKYKSLKTN